ncbi:hypothetical protein ZIOFF_058986 [Zingiber officinale]|uniref:Uncharacterized protein n=1 Tax=Zingiber officinale TaxID=94328 RepID=A0A8J5KB23_ZINOF|nr:hypothetical protein ZIOFF_058986 [Zingiber officinale]
MEEEKSMARSSCPSSRWRCCCQSWVDPMEEEALYRPHEGSLLSEMEPQSRSQEAKLVSFCKEIIVARSTIEDDSIVGHELFLANRSREAESIGFSKEMTATNKTRACQDLPAEMHQIGDQGTGTAKSRLLMICAANSWKHPSFILCEEGPEQQKRQVTLIVS